MAVLEEARPAASRTQPAGLLRSRVAILAAFALYAGLLAFVIPHHEAWFDEGQAWLIARDSNLGNLFSRLAYEGQPGLWHLILMVPAKTLPYSAINWISGAFGALGVYVFLTRSPFPTPVKVLVPFTFFLFYQYAVVARNYVLIPVVLFAIAAMYRRRTEHPVAFAALLFVLANTSTHGFLIAASLAAIEGVELLVRSKNLGSRPARRELLPLVVLGLGMAAVAFALRPPADRTFAVAGLHTPGIKEFFVVVFGMLNNSLADNKLVLFPFLAAGLWFLRRRRALHLFVVPAGALLIFFAFVHRAAWHEGVLFLVWVFAFWLALENEPAEPAPSDRFSRLAALSLLAVVCLFQIYWSFATAKNDVNEPYSGSRDLAHYIKENDLQDSTIFGVHWSSMAVNPYFEGNVYANYDAPGDVSFWEWSDKNEMVEDYRTIDLLAPDFVVVPVKVPGMEDPANAQLKHYEQRAVFGGNMYWKTGVLEPDLYILFERKDSP